jgi:hypothetical protein
MKILPWYLIFMIPMGLATLLFLVILGVQLAGQKLYLPPFSSDELIVLCFWAILLLGVLWVSACWCVRAKSGYFLLGRLLLLLPMLAVFGVVALANIVFDIDAAYARYDSPDGSHSLVMKDESFLVYEHGEVYVMTSPVTMKKVSDLRTPFSPKYHKLIWYDNYVELILYEETIRIPLK